MLTIFPVSRSHLLELIVGGGMALDFLPGLKANYVMAGHIQKRFHRGIYFDQENALWDIWDFSLIQSIPVSESGLTFAPILTALSG